MGCQIEITSDYINNNYVLSHFSFLVSVIDIYY